MIENAAERRVACVAGLEHTTYDNQIVAASRVDAVFAFAFLSVFVTLVLAVFSSSLVVDAFAIRVVCVVIPVVVSCVVLLAVFSAILVVAFFADLLVASVTAAAAISAAVRRWQFYPAAN